MSAEIGPGVQAEYVGPDRPDVGVHPRDVRTVVTEVGGHWLCSACGVVKGALLMRDTPSGAPSGLWCRCAWRPLYNPRRSTFVEDLRKLPVLEDA